MLNNKDILISCISETWFSESVTNSMVSPSNNYFVFRKDRSARGGGVCIVAKAHPGIKYCEVTIPSKFAFIEIVSTDVFLYEVLCLSCMFLLPPTNAQ